MSAIEHAGLSEQGPVRPNNEDYIAHRLPEDSELRRQRGGLFVVADGVGGNLAGEVASMEGAQNLLSVYYQSKAKWPDRALKEAFTSANLHVHDLSLSRPEYRRMQTTMAALALVGNDAHLGHLGDTRIYRARQGEVEQLTRDHSEVGELVRMQILTPEEARHHPRRNVITRSLGSTLIPQPDFRVHRVELGDVYVICTDGVWEPVEEPDMAEILARCSAAQACREMLDLAIERGTEDNISVHVVKVLDWESDFAPNDPRPPLWRWLARLSGRSRAESE